MTTLKRNARLLMCAPEHFAVSYAVNPWMDPASWARDNRAPAAAAREWTDLHRTLAGLGADIDLVPSVPGLPDLVFTANAAVVLDRQVLLARFRHPVRQREQRHSGRCRRAAWSMRCASFRPASCSKAPATASGTRRASCSGWVTARARMP